VGKIFVLESKLTISFHLRNFISKKDQRTYEIQKMFAKLFSVFKMLTMAMC
jgi:hypothetical protein